MSTTIYSVVIELEGSTDKILVRPVFDTLYDAQTYINASFNVGVFIVSRPSLIGGQQLPSDVASVAYPASSVCRVKVTFLEST